MRSRQSSPRPSVIALNGKDELIVIEHDSPGFPVKIVGGYFDSTSGKGITFTITNTGKDSLPPYLVGLFHPKLGSYFFFPSEKSGSLLPGQMRAHRCPVAVDGRVPDWFPNLTRGFQGEALCPDDDADFEFRLVLEDSDDKVLFVDKRIGRGVVALMRGARQNIADFGKTSDHWNELRYPVLGG